MELMFCADFNDNILISGGFYASCLVTWLERKVF